MPDGFYERCAELSQWMAHSGESLIGAEPLPDASISNVPATRRGKRCYLHILAGHKGPAILRDVPRPARASLLYSGKEIAIHWHGKSLEVSVPERKRSGLDDVIAIDC